nr:hypothetical protein [Tanacetum cinerariifolium]
MRCKSSISIEMIKTSTPCLETTSFKYNPVCFSIDFVSFIDRIAQIYDEFPLLEFIPTASEDRFPLLRKRDAIAEEVCTANEDKEIEHSNPTLAKIPILDTGKFKQWKFRIQQYLHNEHYALWEVIEFGDSYDAPQDDAATGSASEGSVKKNGRTVTVTTKDMQKRRNDVKARTTLLLALPDENQLRFSKYKTAQELLAAILKTFGGNEATKKTKKNQLKQQYGNFKEEVTETLEQTFNRLQVIVSHLEFMDVEIKQDDLNQKFLTSLALEWLMYTIVWRNISDLDTMSLDDVYNHLKLSGNREVNTASIPTASTQVSPAGPKVATASISLDTACAYIAYQSNGFWKKIRKKISIQGTDVDGFDKSKVECFNCHKMGHFARECRAPRSQEKGRRENYRQGSKEEEQAPKALMAIDGVGWDWSFMENEEENHALVADEEASTEFALMAKSFSDNEVIEFGDSYDAPQDDAATGSASEGSVKKNGRTVAVTTEDMQKRRNDAAILKTFGGNEATKKTKKNQLKQQYGNFKEEVTETLEQTFNRLQVIVSHLEFMDVEIKQDDLNQKFLTSLALEWLMYTIVWRNITKNSSGNREVNTASIPTASTQVSPAGPKVATTSISLDTACAYIASQSNGSQIKYEDIKQIDEDDIKEMDIKEYRAPRSQEKGRRENYRQGSKEEEQAPKALMEIDGVGWDWSFMENEEENHALVADEEAPTEFALMAKSISNNE